MKILILSNYAGGLYLFRKELLKSFIEEGHTVCISVPSDENTPKLKDLCSKIAVTPLDRHGINPFKDIVLIGRYLRLVNDFQPDVVLSYTIKPNLYGAYVCRKKHIPYIMNITGLGTAIEGGGFLSRVLIRLYLRASKRAAKVFFQNRTNMDYMLEHGLLKDNCELLPGSGVNLSDHPLREYPDEKDGIRILAVMRIMRDKGIGEYLESVIRITNEYDNVKFYLAGAYEEDEKHSYESIINSLAENEKLIYLGQLDNVEPFMAKSHIIVHPSYHEGMSNVCLEAAACGRPLVVSDIPGCIETVKEGMSGLSAKSGDADSLCDAIRKMIGMSTDERRNMGLEGRKLVEERFNRQIVIDKYNEAISTL